MLHESHHNVNRTKFLSELKGIRVVLQRDDPYVQWQRYHCGQTWSSLWPWRWRYEDENVSLNFKVFNCTESWLRTKCLFQGHCINQIFNSTCSFWYLTDLKPRDRGQRAGWILSRPPWLGLFGGQDEAGQRRSESLRKAKNPSTLQIFPRTTCFIHVPGSSINISLS